MTGDPISPLLRASNLAAGFGTPLFRGVNLSLAPGDCALLCGPNGSGKTTLLRTLAGLQSPMEGSVEGSAILVPTRIPKVRGFSLEDFLRSSCFHESGLWGHLSADSLRAIDEAMDRLGIRDLADRDLASLSDGQFQKACIATALVRRAAVLLLDEPTAFLDVDARLEVLRTLRSLAEGRRLAILFSSHDLHEATREATRILALSPSGVLLEGPDAPAACFHNLR